MWVSAEMCCISHMQTWTAAQLVSSDNKRNYLRPPHPRQSSLHLLIGIWWNCEAITKRLRLAVACTPKLLIEIPPKAPAPRFLHLNYNQAYTTFYPSCLHPQEGWKKRKARKFVSTSSSHFLHIFSSVIRNHVLPSLPANFFPPESDLRKLISVLAWN